MKEMTKRILDGLDAAAAWRYPIDEAVRPGDDDMIHLGGGYVLSVDDGSPIPSVSLDALMPVGGNVTIKHWLVDTDAVVDEIVVLSGKFAACEES